jgi:hypothetical protein
MLDSPTKNNYFFAIFSLRNNFERTTIQPFKVTFAGIYYKTVIEVRRVILGRELKSPVAVHWAIGTACVKSCSVLNKSGFQIKLLCKS